METAALNSRACVADGDRTASRDLPRPKRPRRSVLCPHCAETVSKTTYYRHKAVYFDERTQEWSRKVDSSESSDDSGPMGDGTDYLGGADYGRDLWTVKY